MNGLVLWLLLLLEKLPEYFYHCFLVYLSRTYVMVTIISDLTTILEFKQTYDDEIDGKVYRLCNLHPTSVNNIKFPPPL